MNKKSSMQSLLLQLAAALTTLFFPVAVLAHHPAGGAVPASAWNGLLSGLGHPVIEVDHLLFVLAAALAAALARTPPKRAAALLLIYAAVGALGTAWRAPGNVFPGAEAAVAGTLLVLAAWLWTRRQPGLAAGLQAAAATGAVHGYAYGEAIIGAEITPLAAYLCGLSLMQALLMLAAFSAVKRLLPLSSQARLPAMGRTAAGLLTAAGLWLLWGTV